MAGKVGKLSKRKRVACWSIYINSLFYLNELLKPSPPPPPYLYYRRREKDPGKKGKSPKAPAAFLRTLLHRIQLKRKVRGFTVYYGIHCPKIYPNFHDITVNVEENITLHEIFRVVSRFPPYISCYIAENRFPLG